MSAKSKQVARGGAIGGGGRGKVLMPVGEYLTGNCVLILRKMPSIRLYRNVCGELMRINIQKEKGNSQRH